MTEILLQQTWICEYENQLKSEPAALLKLSLCSSHLQPKHRELSKGLKLSIQIFFGSININFKSW